MHSRNVVHRGTVEKSRLLGVLNLFPLLTTVTTPSLSPATPVFPPSPPCCSPVPWSDLKWANISDILYGNTAELLYFAFGVDLKTSCYRLWLIFLKKALHPSNATSWRLQVNTALLRIACTFQIYIDCHVPSTGRFWYECELVANRCRSAEGSATRL